MIVYKVKHKKTGLFWNGNMFDFYIIQSPTFTKRGKEWTTIEKCRKAINNYLIDLSNKNHYNIDGIQDKNNFSTDCIIEEFKLVSSKLIQI